MGNKSSVSLLTVEIKVLKKSVNFCSIHNKGFFFRQGLLCDVEHVWKDNSLPYLSRRTHNTHNK